MLTFQRIFQTRQQAMDVYKSQLSRQMLYVESFEGYPQGTSVSVALEIRETRQKIVLNASVDRMMGRSEVTELGLGNRPGLLLIVPITQDVVGPLRAFFLAQAPAIAQPVRPSAVQSAVSSKLGKNEAPLSGVDQCSPTEAVVMVKNFIALSDRGNLYSLFNVGMDVDRKTLRGIYNTVVRKLHPDSHSVDHPELAGLLGDAYQIFNEAYQILQHPVQCAIYREVSRENGQASGMSLNAYTKWLSDYSTRNAQNIRMADDLVEQARQDASQGRKSDAAEHLKLALKYDPYHEKAREMMS